MKITSSAVTTRLLTVRIKRKDENCFTVWTGVKEIEIHDIDTVTLVLVNEQQVHPYKVTEKVINCVDKVLFEEPMIRPEGY